MTQKIIICFIIQSKNDSLWCKWRQDKIVLKFRLQFFPKTLNMKVVKKMCIGASSKVLQKEQRAVFVIPKVYSFLLRKSTLLRILY